MGTKDIKDISNWYSNLAHNQWVVLPVSSPRPSGRYKHASAVFGEKLYILGGSRNGRNLSDFQVLDLTNFTWSSLALSVEQNDVELENGNLQLQEPFSAISGHDMVVWGKKLLVLGGQPKKYSNYVTVRFVDLETQQCGFVKTAGKLPVARGGQSVTIVGSKLIMFGGEDINRKVLNDIHILDLDTMIWDEVEATQPPPSPRYDHTAALHAERYLLIFGGCSHYTCFNDLHVLDLQTMEWSQPETRGDYVTPRAGHSGIAIDDNWFIVGGGDNKSGALETLVLDLTKFVWSVITRVNKGDFLASEQGICLSSALISGEKYLVAFGGYNGKYNNEVFIMKPKLKDPAQRKIFQSAAAAAAAASVSAAYLIGLGNQTDLAKVEDANSEGYEIKHPQQKYTVDLDAIREELSALELSLAQVKEENSLLRGKIDDTNNTHAELSKELLSVQVQLADERSRCFKLEAQIAELQKMLQSLPSIEAEVLSLRRQISTLERNMERTTFQGQASRGVWQWIAGGNA